MLSDVSYDEQGELHSEQVSWVSRLMDAETSAEVSLLEVHRKGLAKADEVCAVQDGAEWLQGLTDYHRFDAIRVLDFAHAAEYVAEIAELVKSAGVTLSKKWLDKQLHKLKQKRPAALLSQARQWLKRYPQVQGLEKKIAYLQKREMQMQYPEYQAAGWPIGSGMVESSNKLVVEARLKGAGMHWDPDNVNKMLVLRNAVCNGRFQEMWKKSRQQQKEQRKLIRQNHQKECYQVACYKLMRLFVTLQLSCPKAVAKLLSEHHPQKEKTTTKRSNSSTTPTNPPPTSNASGGLTSSLPTSSVPHRPAANHPWRKPFLKRSTHRSPPPQQACAKI